MATSMGNGAMMFFFVHEEFLEEPETQKDMWILYL